MIGVLMSATLACPPRRAGPGAVALPAHRAHARDLPGPARAPSSPRPCSTSSPWPCSASSSSRPPPSSTPAPRSSSSSASCRWLLLLVVLVGPPLMRRNGNGRLARLGAAHARGPGPGARRPTRLPRAAPRRGRGCRAAHRLGDPARSLLGASLRARPQRPGRHRRCRGGSLRRQRHRGGSGDTRPTSASSSSR